MKIAIASDHAGYDYRQMLAEHLRAQGHEVIDCGCPGKESCDYPIFGRKAAQLVKSGECERGVLVCGTGFGISLSANRIPGIRCVVCSEPYSAQLSRLHNNSNMLAFGARVIGPELAKMIARIWLETPFEGGRHQRRIDMIAALGRGEDIE